MGNLFVVAYDLREDKLRLELANLLARFGQRVQGSVFECEFEVEDLADVQASAIRILERSDRGDVRFYRLCQACHKFSFGLGDLAQGLGGKDWIVV